MRRIVLLTLLVISSFSYSENLSISTPPFSPPFVMVHSRQHFFSGFSIDIMNEVCKRINTTCRYEAISLEDTFKRVMNGQSDLGIGNITITNERSQYLLFSLPYLASEIQFITLANSTLNAPEDLRGKTVGAQESSIFPDYIKGRFGDSVKVKTYVTITDMMDPLSSGNIDAVILDKPTAQYWYSNNSDVFKFLGPSVPLGLGIGIITNKTNQDLITRVNKALVAMETDGAYSNIYNTYFGNLPMVSE